MRLLLSLTPVVLGIALIVGGAGAAIATVPGGVYADLTLFGTSVGVAALGLALVWLGCRGRSRA